MKKLISLLFVACAASTAYASDDCVARATEKKLAGAAKSSFMKKCTADVHATPAAGTCEGKAKEKKLAGAAKNSFVKKCMADAEGAATAAPGSPAK